MASVARSRPWMSALVLLASSGLTLLAAEGVLRLALNPGDFLQAKLVEDPVLGQRIAPHAPGHDALGFRNASAPQRSRVVAIGDSNTYGVSAPREGSWPYQLQGMIGEPVYNMGLGGFGPLQYLHLAQTTARDLRPGIVLLGLYFGNDLLDAYHLAHGREHWRAWRQSPGVTETAADGSAPEPARRFQGLRDWLSRHSMLYSVLRATVLQRFAVQEREQQVRQSSPDVRWAWSDPQRPEVHTVFTPQSRLAAVDLDRPAVQEGLAISQRALAQIAEVVRGQGAQLLVVLIPTKERAYCRQLQSSTAAMPPALARLCEAEARAKAAVVQTLEARRIAYVDAAPALEAALAQHRQLYPVDADGHAASAGYAVIARAVADGMARLGKP